MTQRPMSRRPHGGRQGNGQDRPTEAFHAQDSAGLTARADASKFATGRPDALAWSQAEPTADDKDALYSLRDPHEQYSESRTDSHGPKASSTTPRPPKAWYRSVPVLMCGVGLIALVLGGGSLVYSLTGVSHKTGVTRPSRPAHSVPFNRPDGTGGTPPTAIPPPAAPLPPAAPPATEYLPAPASAPPFEAPPPPPPFEAPPVGAPPPPFGGPPFEGRPPAPPFGGPPFQGRPPAAPLPPAPASTGSSTGATTGTTTGKTNGTTTGGNPQCPRPGLDQFCLPVIK